MERTYRHNAPVHAVPAVSSECNHGCGCCEHSPAHRHSKNYRPAVSLALLAGGLLLSYAGTAWFAFPGVPFVWYLAAFLPVGIPVIRQALQAIAKKDVFNEFTLMSVASAGAFCIGEYPEAVAVMLFYTVGELLQHRAVERASRNIGNLLDVRPERTCVLRGGAYVSVSPQEVHPGERIEIKPGGRVPLDGILLEKQAAFDTSALTGESMPRTISRNEEVLAGMLVCDRPVQVEVSRPYGQSALARILALVKEAASRKAPAELFIRRFARIYTPVVILLAVLIVCLPAVAAFFMPSFHYVFSDWLYRGLVFLVISCPCALVISIPLGYFGGIGAASRAGILFKGGNYLDAITRVDAVAFDKTGTLTTGRFEVTHCEPAGIPAAGLLAVLLSVEQKSTHPVAQAVVRYARKEKAVAAEVSAVQELAGHGVEAVMNGKRIVAGNLRLLAERGIAVPAGTEHTTATVVACAVDGKYAGRLLLSDTVKEDAAPAIERLKKLGVNDIRLLSGDKEEIVKKLAGKLGIATAYGNLLPEDKAQRVEEMKAGPARTVAFVGDGMNDAPVLALSDVGIAMGGLGSEAAIESADVVIQTDQPSKVAEAIAIGRATRRIVHQNIAGAIGMKAVILLAGALGYASLWGAVFADVGVALLAVLNAIRILYKKF
ncbi:MAG: cadmium-translocating P-type ATPase [Parabacteroides sp.]|nr:cadmium-translocating P-type ATPase [Parabacteroides sp.]